MRHPTPSPGELPTLRRRQSRIPRLPQGAEQSWRTIPPGEAVLPPRFPPLSMGRRESPTLTSCLPRSDESPPQEVPDLGRPLLQAPQLPWPPGESAGQHPLPGVLSAPPPSRGDWTRDSSSSRPLDKALIRRS